MKALRIAASSFLIIGALVACSDDADETDVETTGTEVVETGDSAGDDTTDTGGDQSIDTGVDDGAAVDPAGIDPTKGGDLTGDAWRAADRDQKTEAATVYLESAGLPAEAADVSLATIDVDVYCAGTSHANDPIQPGFEGGG